MGAQAQGLTVGFIGLGVMGEPMCRHVVQKSRDAGIVRVIGFDLHAEPLSRLGEHGVDPAADVPHLMQQADIVLISLPGDDELRALCEQDDGLLDAARPGQTIVDLGTSSVALSRSLRDRFAEKGVAHADAPVARTRAAAESGTLVVLVGCADDLFGRIEPVVGCFAEHVVHCGDVGAGQVVKQMNNMVLFQTVTALAEALAIARRAGVDGDRLFDAMSLGSGDSFALRNHGRKALLPGEFPQRAFSTRYALKDLTYAMDLAAQSGLDLAGAEATRGLFEAAIEQGMGDDYFPTVLRVIEGDME